MSRPPARLPALIHQRTIRLAGRVAVASAPVALSLSVPAAAYANTGLPISVAANSLPVVIGNLQTWLMGILAALATSLNSAPAGLANGRPSEESGTGSPPWRATL